VRTGAELARDLVLVGGGHSHALALRALAMRPIAGLRTTLISPASHTPYSGMLPGLVAGHYRFEETHIDLERLCQWAGARFIAAQVDALDPQRRRLGLVGRPAIDYDLVSIDIGSQPELDSVPGARAHAVPVKPVAGLWLRWQALQQRVQNNPSGQERRIAVVGGGAGSVELALAMAIRLDGSAARIDLYCGAASILQDYNTRARASVLAALGRLAVTVHLDARVQQVEPGKLVFASGQDAAFDELFWCTGAAAAPWISTSGLQTDAQGFLAVRDTLQSTGDDRVFAAGDIASQINHPRPKAGVYAVRQAPVLAHNLRAMLLGKPLRQHRPQRRFLSLVSLGEKMAVADRGPFSASGRWVWRWKDRIDRQFMSRFEDLPQSMPLTAWGRLPELGPAQQQAPCGGCGAKVGGTELSQVLAQLRGDYPGLCAQQDDDAVPIPVADAGPILQSVDVLRELVRDPWLMGRICANHALSDLYACGTRPVSALATVTLPFADTRITQRDLQQLLAGALHEFASVGCRLAGGHSMQGPELALGFVVNGVPMLSADQLLSKRGLVPGDCLVLTKPLGTGVLFAAHMQLAADGRDIAAAISSMVLSNRLAAELAVSRGVSACTDITGFGLLGHLLEMLGDDLAVRLELASLPLLHGALPLLAAGYSSTLHASNAALCAEPLELATQGEPRAKMLFDPQTSGGLLLGIAADRANELCIALRSAGYEDTAIIGQVARRGEGSGQQVSVY